MTAIDRPASRWQVFAYDSDHAGRGPMFVGLLILLPLLGVFCVWAAFAPLNSAAIASGEIVVSSQRKTVQHLEGGLVTEIYVGEGADVIQGAPLIVVQDLNERAQIAALLSQLVNIRAQIARLEAERDGLAQPDFSKLAEGYDVPDRMVKQFAALHQGIFENHVESAASVIQLADSRKTQIRRQIEGLNAQLAAKSKEVALTTSELDAKRALQERGIASEVQVNEIARTAAILEGEVGATLASVAKLEQSVVDEDVAIVQQRNDRRFAALDELQQASLGVENLQQELTMLLDRQSRAVIRAPTSGVVLGIQVHTIGAVVAPGSNLMDIVPEEPDLIILARVDPTDIDLVAPGNRAEVQLSAYKAMDVEKLEATVETVSGDILTDELTGMRYFEARLRVDEEALAKLPQEVELSPGMPADAFLIAGERTLAQYLLSPILSAADRAFRED